MSRMKKLVENLSVKDYDVVEDILSELLQEHYGIEQYDFGSLEEHSGTLVTSVMS